MVVEETGNEYALEKFVQTQGVFEIEMGLTDLDLTDLAIPSGVRKLYGKFGFAKVVAHFERKKDTAYFNSILANGRVYRFVKNCNPEIAFNRILFETFP